MPQVQAAGQDGVAAHHSCASGMAEGLFQLKVSDAPSLAAELPMIVQESCM